VRVPSVKVTIEAGPTRLSFSLKNVVVTASSLLGFRRIKLLAGRSEVSLILDGAVEIEHVKKIGAVQATVIPKET